MREVSPFLRESLEAWSKFSTHLMVSPCSQAIFSSRARPTPARRRCSSTPPSSMED